MSKMRQVIHGEIYYPMSEDKDRILDMMHDYCSAKRFAFQRIKKNDFSGNELKNSLKPLYMIKLNQRYIADACVEAQASANKIKHDEKETKKDIHLIWGGRKNFQDYNKHKITKEQWVSDRNNQIYSRGDKTKKGNPNIRIDEIERTISINDPSERNKWIVAKIYIPLKYRNKIDYSCYDARVMYDFVTNKFTFTCSCEIDAPEIITSTEFGAIGIDTNPNGFAMTEADQYGNLVEHFFFKSEELKHVSTNKRINIINNLVILIINECLRTGKSLVIENLDFASANRKKKKYKDKNGKRLSKKLRRIFNQFPWRKMLNALEARARKMGIAVIKVGPSYTSVLGGLKYKKMYSLSIHNASALVIARKGMGLLERKDFTITEFTKEKRQNSRKKVDSRKKNIRGRTKTVNKSRKLSYEEHLTLAGRGYSIEISKKSSPWMFRCLKLPKLSPQTEELLVLRRLSICRNELDNPDQELVDSVGNLHPLELERTP